MISKYLNQMRYINANKVEEFVTFIERTSPVKIYDRLKEVLKGREDEIVTRQEIQRLMKARFGTNPGSVIPTDYCYNRWNKGISFTEHIFEYMTRSTYKYIGEHVPYSGLIYSKALGAEGEEVIGEWNEGVKTLYSKDKAGSGCLSTKQLIRLYEEYLRILHYELQVLKCQPTELRHLIGRIGELYCAIATRGRLASETNQHGFDVISGESRISVKTTAQKSGFISFNQKTFDQLDEVFIIQYREDDFHVIYQGDKSPIEQIARGYGQVYEVDLDKVKKLGKQLDMKIEI